MIEVVWRGIGTPSTERCQIAADAAGVCVRSVLEWKTQVWEYELHATGSWEFHTLTISGGNRTLTAFRSGRGWVVDGELRSDLEAAMEVDISASPLSNTLPIRRLNLAVGASTDITTAYLSLPGLTLTTDPQRYTRLSEREYLYESRDSDFRRTITVDDSGLVIDYPGLFERQGHR